MKHFNELFEQLIRLIKYQYNFQEKNIIQELEVDKSYLSKVKQGHVPSPRTIKKIIELFELNKNQELALLFSYFAQKNRDESVMLTRMLSLLCVDNTIYNELNNHFEGMLNELKPKKFIKKKVMSWADEQLALPIN